VQQEYARAVTLRQIREPQATCLDERGLHGPGRCHRFATESIPAVAGGAALARRYFAGFCC
jgi:hypothetical protein